MEFLNTVKCLIIGVHQYYVVETGARQQFVCAAHDVWDDKRKQINGLTIFFMDPRIMTLYQIPIVVTPPLGKTAIKLSKTSMLGLERIGIEMDDMYCAVNNNCTTAARAGKL